MKNTKRRVLTLAAAGAATLALLAPQAEADATPKKLWGSKTRSIYGAKATCQLRTWGEQIHDDNAELSCKVSDTAKDGETPYIYWQLDGYDWMDFGYHHGGSGTSGWYADSDENPDGSYGTVRFQVCRTRPLWDSCSSEAVWNL